MKIPTRLLAAVLAVTALSFSLVACGNSDDSDPSTLTVGFVVDPSWAQVPVAQRAGIFDKHGVQVKVVNFPSGIEALQALAAHQVDVATAADVPAAATLTRSPSLRVVGDGSRWQGSRVIARRSAGITSIENLAGRSIGTPLGTSAAYFAEDTLAASRIDAKLVQVAPQATVTAVTRRNVDAVAIFQPYQAQVIAALGDDAVELSGGAYNQHSLYLATDTATTRKSAALSSFFAALNEAGAQLTARSATAITAVADATQLTPDLLAKVLPEFDFTLQLHPDLAPKLATLATWARNQGSLEESAQLPDYGSLLDGEFVKHG
ncbi:ABC transporter substrate-binding protein [Nocardia nova]|uniref:ABC transporter substrate-binding protein n=1 Tax=Nocardia nova TaxID=37330 RepID=A0A2S6AJF3_9NOCA|nr:ABC transporter substrate-binding protein [Nocardia nova]PPJ22627.1 ABC transporter substrate-binding protein [Nocardia nova]PPJ35365.1 ABC transporter substrate-binding protein [Nocardia nova]